MTTPVVVVVVVVELFLKVKKKNRARVRHVAVFPFLVLGFVFVLGSSFFFTADLTVAKYPFIAFASRIA